MAEIISREEATALMGYVARRGLDQDGAKVVELQQALDAHEAAADDAKPAAALRVLKGYAALSALTYPSEQVSGKSILDSAKARKSRQLVLWATLLFLILALGSEILRLWFADLVEPDEGLLLWAMNSQRYALDYLSPFFWGGLGSCVYLTKRLSDEIGSQRFDEDHFAGPYLRIGLGMTLAGVAVVVYDVETFTTNELSLEANAVAFLVGLGVKVVYGAIEKTIDALAEKFELGNLRHTRRRAKPAAAEADENAGEAGGQGDDEAGKKGAGGQAGPQPAQLPGQ